MRCLDDRLPQSYASAFKLKAYNGLHHSPLGQIRPAKIQRESRVTKKDIVRTISDEVGLTQQQTKKIVQRTFDSIIDTLVREGRIELRNFGVFEVKLRAARRARNPRTGDEVIVPEKHVVTFKPGKYMEAKVQEADLGGHHGETPDAAEQGGSDQQGSKSTTTPSTKISGRWDED